MTITLVTRITDFEAFCRFGDSIEGLLQISKISDQFVSNIRDYVDVGEKVNVKNGPANKTPDGNVRGM